MELTVRQYRELDRRVRRQLHKNNLPWREFNIRFTHIKAQLGELILILNNKRITCNTAEETLKVINEYYS